MDQDMTVLLDDVVEMVEILRKVRDFEDLLWGELTTDRQRYLLNEIRETRSLLYCWFPPVTANPEDKNYVPAWYPGIDYITDDYPKLILGIDYWETHEDHEKYLLTMQQSQSAAT